MKQIEEKISKVKSTLIIEQPYFGSIASYLKPILNENIKTFKSSTNSFEYNDTYLESLSNGQLAFILTAKNG